MHYRLALVAIFAAYPIFAADGQFSAYGVGELSCGKYLQVISTDPQSVISYKWWLAGFVTGANVERSRAISTDSAAHEGWVKQYCEKNPLDSFVKAAIELNKELDKRRVK